MVSRPSPWPLATLLLALGCQPPAPPAEPRAPRAPAAHDGAVLPTRAPPRVAVGAAAIAARPTRRAAMRFDANGRAFPLPLVDVTVGGLPALMVLDTGATRHVVAEWAAREAGLATRASRVDVADHTGKRLPVVEAEGGALAISGWGRLAAEPAVLVGSLPDALRRLGIAGILAPQLLGGGSAVVLDMPQRELLEMAVESAQATYGAAGKALAPAGALRSCTLPTGAMLHVVRARIGGEAAELQLDTGAADSDLKEGSAPARSLSPRAVAGERTYTATGWFVARKLPQVHVVVGEVETDIDVTLAPAEPRPTCPRDGFLGMDVLSRSVVVLAQDKSFVRWIP